MGESAMIFRVRWWVESYVDTRHVINRVHTTLQAAFAHAGIEIPYPTQTLNLQVEPETAGRLSLAFREPDQPVS
jgi:small-conductance mechanosensitive channel